MELPESVHQLTALLPHLRAPKLQVPQMVNFGRLGCVSGSSRGFFEEEDVPTLIGFVGDALL
jgi:hypothetical protein